MMQHNDKKKLVITFGLCERQEFFKYLIMYLIDLIIKDPKCNLEKNIYSMIFMIKKIGSFAYFFDTLVK